MDPAEEKFPFTGRINFKGVEGEDPYLIGNAESIKQEYINKFKEHSNSIKTICESYGWNYFMHVTNQELVNLIINFPQINILLCLKFI